MRNTQSRRFLNFLGGEVDDTPSSIPEQSASVMENWYKRRNILSRRAGFSPLGSGNLSGSTAIKGLEWFKRSGTEYLVVVHDGDVRDMFHATAGTVFANGTDKLPASGSADVNGAVCENLLFLGNGTDPNVRVKGSATLAADLTTADVLQEPSGGTTGIYVGTDFTIAGWVKFDTLTGDQVVCSIYNNSVSADTPFVIKKDNGSSNLRFLCITTFGAVQELVTSTVTLVAGQWHHFACRHDGGTNISIAVDGETPVNVVFTTGVPEPATTPFIIGGLYNVATSRLDGKVARVGFWRTANGGGGALTNGNLTTLYNSGSAFSYASLPAALKTSVLKGWWDLDEESGTRDDSHGAFDLSPAGSGVGSATGPGDAWAVAQAMVDAVTTAPTLVTSISGADTHPGPDTFEYRISFLNADGVYGEAGPSVSATVAQDFEISVQTIPTCASGQECSGRRIWRRSGGSAVFKYVADILDNTTTTYIDAVLNADLGEELVDFNTAMPPCKYLVEWKSRLVGAGNEDELSTVFISNENEPWYCPESPDTEDPRQGTRATIQGRGAGEVTGLCVHGSYVAVFTHGAGYFLSGDQTIDMALTQFGAHGCVAHRTIKSAMGLLLWLGPDGVYAWDGNTEARISDDQRATLEAMTAAEAAAAHAYVWEGKYFLCWPAGCIFFDLVHRQWGTNTNWTWALSEVTEFTGSAKEKVYAAIYGAARVHQLETGATDNGTTITARWASKDVDMGLPSRDKRAHYLRTRWKKGTGTATASLKTGSGKTVQVAVHDISQVEDADETVSRQMESCVEQARSEWFRLDISIASTASTVELLEAGLEWTPAS